MNWQNLFFASILVFAAASPAITAAQVMEEPSVNLGAENQNQPLPPNERVNLGERQVQLDNGNWVDCNGDCSRARVYAFWRDAGDADS